MKKKIVIGTFLILFVTAGIMVYFGQRAKQNNEDYYSGTIEATTAELAFQVSGRVTTIYAQEGERAGKDQLLAELDAAEYRARYNQAAAALQQAQKNLLRLKKLLEFYEQSVPAEIARAEASLQVTRALFEEARLNRERYANLFQSRSISPKEWEAVVARHDTAQARLAEAEAGLSQAQSNRKKIETAEKEIEVAEAQELAARAVLDLAALQLEHTRLKAPFDGIITSRNVEPGEFVVIGREVFSLSDLATVDLKIFVDEAELGKVKPGQAVEVKVDTFPEKIYRGTVDYISPEGEFTPKMIQTFKERIKLVYLVKIAIPNSDMELKTGMPADAWLR